MRRVSTPVLPGRFQIHGLEVEVEPAFTGLGWRARVMSPSSDLRWHEGRRAWDAIDAAAIAHLAAAPVDETYRRLAGVADAAEQLTAA
jgi:hypothetical protein